MNLTQKTAVAVGGGILIGATFSGTAALWSDADQTTGTIRTGEVLFAVESDEAEASPGSVDYRVPTTATEDLMAEQPDGAQHRYAVAVPITVEAISQGNRGLRYRVDGSAWNKTGDPDATNIWQAADTEFGLVADPSECAVDKPVSDITDYRVIVDAAYSDTTTPAIETWCLKATLDELPGSGTYTNRAGVSGNGPGGSDATASATWGARVNADIDPTSEGQLPPQFTYEFNTFRPGQGGVL